MALVVETVATTVTTNGTSHVITMPSGIVAGDLLLCLYSCDGNDTQTAPGDWVPMTAGVSSSSVVHRHFFKIADGGDSLTVTSGGGNQQASAVCYRISGWDPDETVGNTIQITETTGSGDSSPDPPSNTPNNGSQEYLFIAMGGCDRRTFDTTTPSGYSNLQRAQSAGANGSSTATAEKIETKSAAEDPGVFGIASNDEWTSATIIVHPAGLTPVEIPVPVGALVFNNGTPAVTPSLGFGIDQPVGALVFGGDATALQFDIRRDPPAGTLVFGGLAPLGLEAHLKAMPAGALVFTGELEAVLVSVNITVPVGTLVFGGLTPTLDITKLLEPGAGALVFAGQTPVRLIQVMMAMPVGTLAFAGTAENILIDPREMGVASLDFNVQPGFDMMPGLGFGINMPVDEDGCP